MSKAGQKGHLLEQVSTHFSRLFGGQTCCMGPGQGVQLLGGHPADSTGLTPDVS